MERVDALNRCEFVNNLVKIIRGLSNTKKTASIALKDNGVVVNLLF